jgi:predicted O-methyltransferase YrrM
MRTEHREALGEWLTGYYESREHMMLIESLDKTKLHTPAHEVAVLVALVEQMKAKRVLEIGTYFGGTAYYLAAALTKIDAGCLVTIDPFGKDRVPNVMKAWPATSRAVTEFHPLSSMDYFSDFESRLLSDPKQIFDLVFVDGNHRHAFALFDLLCSSENLRPGGAIVVDNIEEDGPKSAVIQFMAANPAWSLFFRGSVWKAPDVSSDTLEMPTRDVLNLWCILLAPTHIQIAYSGRKLRGLTSADVSFSGLRLNAASASGDVILSAHLGLRCIPNDFHLTNRGWDENHGRVKLSASPTHLRPEALFAKPVSVKPWQPGAIYVWELDLAAEKPSAHLLLDAEHPVDLIRS